MKLKLQPTLCVLILFLLLSNTGIATAQKLVLQPIAIDTPTCLAIDTINRALIYPGESRQGMEHFYSKLNTLLTKDNTTKPALTSLHILHMGGSHIQAGDISHQLRTHLTEMAPNMVGDRGLLFPFRAIQTNGPLNYGLSYTGRWTGSRCISQMPDIQLGLSGAAAITSDSAASLTLNLRESGKWNYDQLHILGEASDSTVYPIVITQEGDTIYSTRHLAKADHDIFNFMADGIYRPGYHFILPKSDSLCTITFVGLGKVKPAPIAKKKGRKPTPNYQPLDSAHHFIFRGILPQSSRIGITYTESGINGAAVPSWLRCNPERFKQELELLPPDLVILAIGINDANVPPADFDTAQFKANYRTLISRIREVNPQASLLFFTNNDCWINTPRMRRQPNPNTRKAVKAFYSLAAEYNTAVFDEFSLMGGYKSAEKWVKAQLLKKDHIHFTSPGYFLFGDLLYNAIINDIKLEE